MKINIELTNINTIIQLRRIGNIESVIIDLLNDYFDKNKTCECGRLLETNNELYFDTCQFCLDDEEKMHRDIQETQNT